MFPVKNKEMIREGYLPSPSYRLIKEQGLFIPRDIVMEKLVEEIGSNPGQP
jgi:hypothetical protein